MIVNRETLLKLADDLESLSNGWKSGMAFVADDKDRKQLKSDITAADHLITSLISMAAHTS
ncbi:MAG: hypothetical protein PHQ43_01015 [Dehalococcoidales bacterium]|nr:hypothetical protein [Dehalococcoidales bacterium]